MIRKGFVKTCIYNYMNDNNINTLDDLINCLPELYKHLKEHPDYGDILPNVTYQIFLEQVDEGYRIAIDPQYKLMRELKKNI